MRTMIKCLLPTVVLSLAAAGCHTVDQSTVSPEQRALVCQNLRAEIISNDAFTQTTASSPSPMQGYSPNRKTELYSKYDQYDCKT